MTIERVKDKERLRELLLLADPDWDMVMKYLPQGEMYAVVEAGEPVCEAVVAPREDGCLELKNLATRPDRQRRGLARALVDHLCQRYKGRYPALYVGTSGPEVYEHMGFARDYVVKNFFLDNYPEPIYDEGVLCVDMYYLKRAL